jgi:CRISPR/Cas system-associated endonuclease Cas1
MGDLALEPLVTEDGLELLTDEEADGSEEAQQPVRVSERRTIPVEDVDAVWVFREIDLNARVLVFLAQHKVPVHFFNYYGFYAGSFYPREYLHAG